MSDEFQGNLVLREALGPPRMRYTRDDVLRLIEQKSADMLRRLPFPARQGIAYRTALAFREEQLHLEVFLVTLAQRPLALEGQVDQQPHFALRDELAALPERIQSDYANYVSALDDEAVDEANGWLRALVEAEGGRELTYSLADRDITLLLPDRPALKYGQPTEFYARVSMVSTQVIQLYHLHEVPSPGRVLHHRERVRYTCALDSLSPGERELVRLLAVCCLNRKLSSLHFLATPLFRPGSSFIAQLQFESMVADEENRHLISLIEEMFEPRTMELFPG